MNKLEIIVNTLISSTETEADRKWRLKWQWQMHRATYWFFWTTIVLGLNLRGWELEARCSIGFTFKAYNKNH